MVFRSLVGLFLLRLLVYAQTICQPTPIYSPCEITFEMTGADAAAHPNPYLTVELAAEMRRPSYRTFLMPGYWDGGNRLVVRFAPTEPGNYTFRIKSNLKSIDGKEGTVIATPSDTPGFIKAANVHHWSYLERFVPHLWMGDTCLRFPFIDRSAFETVVNARAAQKFNHIRGLAIGSEEDSKKIFPSPDQVNPAYFRELDDRILYMNKKGIIADLMLAAGRNHLRLLFPQWQQRERYIRYLVARYAAMNVTWQGVEEFETYDDGRGLLKEIGVLLKKLDPYDHPLSTGTNSTSAPLLADSWMDYAMYRSPDDPLNAIEHQIYPVPFVNGGFAQEDSGAGKTSPNDVDADAFRRRLWNTAMDGQYPVYANTGTSGWNKGMVDPKYLDSPAAKQMTFWYNFFAQTRHWELEPYFDADGGRALALDDVEYIVYVEKPGPVEVAVLKHKYDVRWFNPITGEFVAEKDFKGERYTGEPPSKDHDWVLHISREGHKEGMLRSYKFESRPLLMQEVETSPKQVPFQIAEPAQDALEVSKPPNYSVKITRETRATRAMMFLWTGDVTEEGNGYRVLGIGPQGKFHLQKEMARKYPAVLHVRLLGLNGVGKVYSLDTVFRLTP